MERFTDAPPRLSPQGHLPTAKSVVVAGIHIPDASLELGGEPVPHYWGTSIAASHVNAILMRTGFALAKLLEKEGYKSIPTPQTAIWRYRPFKELENSFTPDISHIHAATAAGLGVIGYNGMFMSPEYGNRVRMVTVITEALLEPDPMYDGPELCDKCMECVKHCTPAQGLKKEVDGMCEVDMGGKTFKYANTNKWRCAWAERFQLNYDINVPEKINEESIVPLLAENREGWGSACEPCWRYCLPPYLRQSSDLRKTPTRKSFWMPRKIVDEKTGEKINQAEKVLAEEIRDIAFKHGLDLFGIASAEELSRLEAKPELMRMFGQKPYDPKWSPVSADPKNFLPEAKSVIVLGTSYPKGCDGEFDFVLSNAFHRKQMDARVEILRHMEERGFPTVSFTTLADNYAIAAAGVGELDEKTGEITTAEYGTRQIFEAGVITAAELAPTAGKKVDVSTPPVKPQTSRRQLTDCVKALALQNGADLVGIAPIERFEGIKTELRKLYNEQELGLSVIDKNRNMGGHAVIPEIVQEDEVLKDPRDYLPDAKSVIVIGVSYPAGIIDRAEKAPAEAVGPYSMYVHECASNVGVEAAITVAKMLSRQDHKAVPVEDLCKTASKAAHTFGQRTDCWSSRYAAVLAGLGQMGWSGCVITPEFGLRQRFVAIVTDVPLEPTPLYDGKPLCEKCFRCVDACPVKAVSREGVSISLAGKTWEQAKVDRLRCDWSKKYGFIADAGPKYMGCQHNIMPPEKITSEAIVDAMKKMDPIQKQIPCIVENCLLNCPASGRQE
ncbi:MAG: hypothetical protein K8S55_01910 [Phycisphaerae bacterium]|nr:hypothetical protein [Phycisphaerae bacterium]